MSESRQLSGLARGLNMKRISNKLAVAGLGVATVLYVARAVTGQWMLGEPMTLIEALTSAIVVFVAWALARELDPDHPWPAAVAMAASFAVALWFVPAVLAVVAAVLALRMVSGTVAKPLAVFDLGVLVVVGLGSGHELATWSIAIVAFVFLKVAPEVGRLRWWAVGALTVGFVAGWYTGELGPVNITATTAGITVGILVIAAIAASRAEVSVRTDARSGKVERKRVAMSRLAAGLIAASATLIGGLDTMWEIAPVGIALTIVATVSLIPPLAGPTADGLPARTTDEAVSESPSEPGPRP